MYLRLIAAERNSLKLGIRPAARRAALFVPFLGNKLPCRPPSVFGWLRDSLRQFYAGLIIFAFGA
jgi:hypothetical protein